MPMRRVYETIKDNVEIVETNNSYIARSDHEQENSEAIFSLGIKKKKKLDKNILILLIFISQCMKRQTENKIKQNI
ncbi:hypothetical protein BLOT_002813 [Blomia tropicalis]|nr:hypothetical protein BLOT_002813 [Blomia tropicalis]